MKHHNNSKKTCWYGSFLYYEFIHSILSVSYLKLTFKLLVLQLFLSFGLFIGQLLSYAHRHPKVSLKDIKTIIINRSDRIGDAVLTMPLLEIFINECRVQGYTWTFIILASRLNFFVLSALKKYEWVTVEISDIDLPEYVQGIGSLFKKIQDRVIRTFFVHTTQTKDTTTLLLDFMANGDAAVPLKYRENGNPLIFGLNALTSTILYDRSLPRALVHHSQSNLIETYVSLLEDSIQEMQGLRKKVYKTNFENFYPSIETVYPEIYRDDFDIESHALHECHEWKWYYEKLNANEKKWAMQKNSEILKNWQWKEYSKDTILIFLGAYSIRSLPTHTWGKMISNIAEQFPEKTILLMDGPEDSILRDVWAEKFPPNVVNFWAIIPLKAFALVASKCGHVIGLDGGGINFVRRFTNSLSIFTFANPLVWQAFSGHKNRTTIKGIDGWSIGNFHPKDEWIIISDMSRSHYLLPTFNIAQAKILVENIDIELICEWIRKST